MANQITQDALFAYRELERIEIVAREPRQALRKRILADLENGVRVEAGLLACVIRTREMKMISREKIVAALGIEEYDRLRGAVEPTKYKVLYILEISPAEFAAPKRSC